MKKNSMDFDESRDADYNALAPLDQEEMPQAEFSMYEDDVISLTEEDLWSF